MIESCDRFSCDQVMWLLKNDMPVFGSQASFYSQLVLCGQGVHGERGLGTQPGNNVRAAWACVSICGDKP